MFACGGAQAGAQAGSHGQSCRSDVSGHERAGGGHRPLERYDLNTASPAAPKGVLSVTPSTYGRRTHENIAITFCAGEVVADGGRAVSTHLLNSGKALAQEAVDNAALRAWETGV